MTLKQCAAIRPDGERCKRPAQEGSEYCHSHRLYVEEKPPAIQPLPEGKIELVSPSAWAFCAFCGDAYLLKALRPGDSNRLACRGCYFRAMLLDATKDQQKRCYVGACQVEELAVLHGITYDEAIVEIHEPSYYLGSRVYQSCITV
ncbi:MAG TPA: hypothetical protein PLQ38_02090, partial [Methanothrix sp.]|nr:hypothetical protein [Methanothrix sp.]